MAKSTNKKTIIPLVVLVIIVLSWSLYKVIYPRRERIKLLLEQYDSVPPFSFKDLSGKMIGLSDLRGKYWICSFFTTRSVKEPNLASRKPSDKPQVSKDAKLIAQMYSIQRSVNMHPNVLLVSITLDPDHDTAEVLSDYIKKYNIPPNRWLFLRGKKSEVRDLMKKGFKLGFYETLDGKGINHGMKLILVDAKGFIRGYYGSQTNESKQKLLTELGVLLLKGDK